ncbi:uncharacterized protein LOC118756892 [Rhagoletis pomonella]|uniref:uncharacterized protein LOC118756892 n=1 Tax=Rhagoletis pomonella TaxID=28610 RepID=UPI00178720CA|nr:uncharacterized protein LOC118756892 [Rhagoletis pomonella]
MESFIRLAEAIIEFESDFSSTPPAEQNKHGLAIQQDELKDMWEKTKQGYDTIINKEGLSKEDIKAIRRKHKSSFASYVKCMSAMASQSETLVNAEKDVQDQSVREHNIHLPPCDTDVFKGDYLSWPSFRDMFTAIYILNKRLTPVEKLFHLNQKTQGEAKDIVRKCPLTNEGFQTAWKSLCERYENKRILVNTQLKILFNLNSVDNECGSSIKRLQRDINNCLSSLNSHQINVSNWDAIIVYLCSTKLPESTLALWEQTIDHKNDIPMWEDMDKFLSNRFQTLETLSGLKNSKAVRGPKPQHTHKPAEASPKRLGVFQASVTKFTCIMCQSNEHKLRSCSRFLKMTPSERIEFMKNNNSCLNCLKSGHTVSRCTCSFNCSKCHSRHHTLLHLETDQQKPTAHQMPPSSTGNRASSSKQAQTRRKTGKPNSTGDKNVKSCFANSNNGVLLGTACVNIHYNGTDFFARALIDSGSECSFITEGLKRRINLPSKRLHAQVSGITNSISAQVKEACNIEIRSPIDPLFRSNTTVLVLAQLTGNLPTTHISAETKQAFPDLVLADKRFFVNEQVDLVLGGDIYPEIILSGLKKNVLNTLLAQETVFGWILTGRPDATSATNHIASYFSEVALDKQLTAFWEVEDLPKSKSLSEEDKYCEELYKNTTQRTQDGKYVVSLPFRQDFPENVCLGPSLKRACSQFFRHETRLAKDPGLQKEYNRVLSEYEALGHMSKLINNIPAESSDNYFLPHHAVIKAESTSTKLRVVFNASSPTANGVSLNDVLLP